MQIGSETLNSNKKKEDNKSPTENMVISPASDSYDELHEGKVVMWDESFDKKPVEKAASWDEEIGEEG